MRNPLKKLQKKINFRLASNAAQHSQPQQPTSKKVTGDTKVRRNDSVTSVTDQDHDDPLFNNRSSKLRLALAESKKAENHQADAIKKVETAISTTPKRKKKPKSGRTSLGGGVGDGQRKTHSVGAVPAVEEEKKDDDEGARSKSLSPEMALAPVSPSRSCVTKSLSSPQRKSTLHSPTMASKQKMRDKVELTSLIGSHHGKRHTSTATKSSLDYVTSVTVVPKQSTPKKKKIPPGKDKSGMMRDPNLDRIAKAAAALDNTGNALFEKGEYDKAMATYVKALKLKNRSLAGAQLEDVAPKDEGKKQGPAKAHPTAPAIPQVKQQSEPSKASTNADNASAGGADDIWISVATSINNIGYLRQQSGQASAEETMQAYQNSLQIKRRVLGKDNLSVGKTLNNLGTVHYLKREYEQALQAYREALQIMTASLGPHHLDVGTVHSNIGDVYWAQSGEVKFSENGNACPQQYYQASRNAALQHYRQSLEIRWEELKDHHDPKVIRLLEKIAALEMGENFLALVQNNHKHRQSPKAAAPIPAGGNSPGDAATVDPDEAIEAETSQPLVQHELQTLHAQVKEDVKTVDMMERKMAIDMVKDKLRLIREMKKLSTLNLYGSDDEGDEVSITSGLLTPIRAPALSPVQRTEALSAVKERLQQLRDSRTKGDELPIPRCSVGGTSSDLKEADRSPTNFFLTHRASQLLNRTNGNADRTVQPPASVGGLSMLRKFSFNESENDPEAAGGSTGIIVSSRASHSLVEGIDALRSLSNIPNNSSGEGNPWVIASTMANSPEKSICSPKTALPVASMAAF